MPTTPRSMALLTPDEKGLLDDAAKLLGLVEFFSTFHDVIMGVSDSVEAVEALTA